MVRQYTYLWGVCGVLMASCGSVVELTDDAGVDASSPDAMADAAHVDASRTDAQVPVDATIPEPVYEFYVDANSGDDDNNPGTNALPFQTITHALVFAVSGETVKVRPGRYDVALGEVFPLQVPVGVTLLGDEPSKGLDVKIAGTNPDKFINPVLQTGAGAVIAGLSIQNIGTEIGAMGLVLDANQITVRNNTIHNNGDSGIYVIEGSINHHLIGNIVRDNTWVGIGFISGGVGSKVEGNHLHSNTFGVEYDAPGGDLGGGSAGSIGGNIISCNRSNDVWTNQSITISAANNFWDHVPPTIAESKADDGTDIFHPQSTVITTNAAIAPEPCLDSN